MSQARARDAYLAWQAEIGTDDVVLAAPLPRPTRLARAAGSPAARPQDTRARHASTPEMSGYADAASAPRSGGPAHRADAPPAPDFFQAIAEKLAAPSPRSKRTAPQPPPSTAPAMPRNPIEDAVAATTDLAAFWSLLETRYPEWFPGAKAPLARAKGHAAPRLAVVELAPRAAANGTSEVFSGDDGLLLDKMMTAIGLSPADLYLTAVMKTPPPGRQWALRDTARMLPALFHELRLARCQCVLVLGEACARAVLKTGKGVPDLLRSPVDAGGLSLSATWHPGEMRADESRKKPAWEHLQWLRGLLPARGS